jgi:hypothetical protein
LCMKTRAQDQQQDEAHCVNISSLEPGCGARRSVNVYDRETSARWPIPLSNPHHPDPLL